MGGHVWITCEEGKNDNGENKHIKFCHREKSTSCLHTEWESEWVKCASVSCNVNFSSYSSSVLCRRRSYGGCSKSHKKSLDDVGLTLWERVKNNSLNICRPTNNFSVDSCFVLHHNLIKTIDNFKKDTKGWTANWQRLWPSQPEHLTLWVFKRHSVWLYRYCEITSLIRGLSFVRSVCVWAIYVKALECCRAAAAFTAALLLSETDHWSALRLRRLVTTPVAHSLKDSFCQRPE